MSAASVPVTQAPPLNLRAVFFGFTETKLDDAFDPLLPGQMLAGWNTATPLGAKCMALQMVDTDQKVRVIDFKTRFEFTYRVSPGGVTLPASAQADKPPPEFAQMKLAATIKAELVVSFFLHEDLGMPDPQLVDAWAKSTVLSVGWPYWREFCQTAIFRMQLPSTLLPLLFINRITLPTGQPAPADQQHATSELSGPDGAGAEQRSRARKAAAKQK